MESWKRTLYAAWVAQFLCIVGFQFVQPFMPLIVSNLGHVDDKHASILTGQIMGVASFTMAFFAPLWGIVADRYGRKSMVIRAMFGGAIAVGLLALSTHVSHLFVFRALQGAFAGTVTACVALVSSVTPSQHSGYALGIMQGAVFGAQSIGPWIGAVLYVNLGFRGAAVAGAVLLAAGGVLVKFTANEEFKPPVGLSHREEAVSGFDMLRSAGFIVATLMFFQISFANSAFSPSFAYYLKDLIGRANPGSLSADVLAVLRKLSPTRSAILPGSDAELAQAVGAMASIAGFVAAGSAGFFGRLGDRLGHKKVLIICTASAGLFSIPTAFAQNLIQLVILRVLFGLSAAGIMPSANTILRNMTAQQHLGKAYGFMQSFRAAGMGVGMMAGGVIGAYWGFGAPFFVTGLFFFALAPFIVIFIKGHRPAPDESEQARSR